MTEANPAYQRLLRPLVSGSLVWCTSSCGLRCSRPLNCTSLSRKVVGGLLVVYRPILERGGAEVFIDTTAMVAGLVMDTDEKTFVPSLRCSAVGTNA